MSIHVTRVYKALYSTYVTVYLWFGFVLARQVDQELN